MIVMDKNRMLLLWIAAGAGVILLYSAYKGKSPTSLVSNYADGTTPVADLGTNSTALPTTPGDKVSASFSGDTGFTTDVNGFTVDVPSAYSDSPSTFIPSPYSNG